jgi:SmpA / OmlA family
MIIAPKISHRIHLAGYATLVLVSLFWIVGCATNKAELKQEIEVLLNQTREEVRQETKRMDLEIAQLRSEVGQLHSAVGGVNSKVGRLGSEVGRLGSDVALLQIDMRKSDTSMVDLATRVNQLDRRVVKSEKSSPSNEERASRPGDAQDRAVSAPVATDASPPLAEDPTKSLKHGMSQQDILHIFGPPHGKERILDSIYWYYADGELKGQYIRFDATTGNVNGWSTFSPQHFQIDLRTTQGGPLR